MRRVKRLEDVTSPERQIVVLCDLDGYYHCEGKVLSETDFDKWAETLSKNIRLIVVKVAVNVKDPLRREHFPESPIVENV